MKGQAEKEKKQLTDLQEKTKKIISAVKEGAATTPCMAYGNPLRRNVSPICYLSYATYILR